MIKLGSYICTKLYGGREGSPAPALKSRAAKCKSRAANATNERGCLNLVHAVSHYHMGMEFRFALTTLNLLVNQEFK